MNTLAQQLDRNSTTVPGQADSQVNWLCRLLALFTVLLIGVTWPLWWQAPSPISPRIPWFQFLTGVPGWVDRICVLFTLFGCCVTAQATLFPLGSSRAALVSKIGAGLYVGGLLGAVLLDQHRLQPWVTQFLLVGVLLLIAKAPDVLRSWKIIIAAIYIWSAISKCDAAFMANQGQLFLNGLLDPLGIDHSLWTPQLKQQLAAVFPMGELLAGMMLLLPTTRRWGFALSIVMHVALLWILGVGLRHEWGVLLWNLFFILQNIIVFGPDWNKRVRRRSAEVAKAKSKKKQKNAQQPERPALEFGRIPMAYTLIVAIYPALELAGKCDHWPAWAVYCSRPAQVHVLIDETAAKGLPAELQKFVGQPAPLQEVVPFSLDAWSFTTRSCPIYPQERYRVALALALLGPHCPNRTLTVEVRSPPDRDTGLRPTKKTIFGVAGLTQFCKQFKLNTVARTGS